jgi:7-carboxy-7-deazaguanine synthase
MYAVDPDEVRQAERLTTGELLQRVAVLPRGPRRVIITGGNPVLFDLSRVVAKLHEVGYRVGVETQGTLWRPWLRDVDQLVISPKPPSSGMTMGRLHTRFMEAARPLVERDRAVLKVVIFDDDDLEWLSSYRWIYSEFPLYLSVGLPVGLDPETVEQEISSRYAWLAEQVARRQEFSEAVVLPQLHVVAWGTARGV